jgi:hypothetical protein
VDEILAIEGINDFAIGVPANAADWAFQYHQPIKGFTRHRPRDDIAANQDQIHIDCSDRFEDRL